MKQCKRWMMLLLTVALMLVLVACGGGNKKDIIGTWHVVDTETQTEYGLGIEFTKDGKMRYGLTEEILTALSDGNEADAEDALAGLEMLMNIEYKIKSDTEMEITISALWGLGGKESAIIPYSLNGDTLEFDGATYTRVK